MRTRVSPTHDTKPDLDRREKASALIRLISYARDEAATLDAQFLTYCLEAALAAAQEDLAPSVTVDAADLLAQTQPDPNETHLGQLH